MRRQVFLLVLGFVSACFSLVQIEYFLNADEDKSNQVSQELCYVDSLSKLDIGQLQKTSQYPPSILKRSPFFKIKVPVLEVVSLEEQEGKEEILISAPEVKKIEPFSYKGRGNIKGRMVVFIEDNWTGKVYFVGKGDIVGDYKVLDILEKEVILYKEGEKEIRLSAKITPQEDKSGEKIK